MKQAFFLFLVFSTYLCLAQAKDNQVHYNKLLEVKGTNYVVASVENWGKVDAGKNGYLLFIDTKTGEKTQANLPNGAFIRAVEQVRIDSLGINIILAGGYTVNLNGNKTIDYNDPQQLLMFSTDGKEQVKLTEDKFFVRQWVVNNSSGSITVTGYFDSNSNGKFDKDDKSEILVYDLRTRKILSRI